MTAIPPERWPSWVRPCWKDLRPHSIGPSDERTANAREPWPRGPRPRGAARWVAVSRRRGAGRAYALGGSRSAAAEGIWRCPAAGAAPSASVTIGGQRQQLHANRRAAEARPRRRRGPGLARRKGAAASGRKARGREQVDQARPASRCRGRTPDRQGGRAPSMATMIPEVAEGRQGPDPIPFPHRWPSPTPPQQSREGDAERRQHGCRDQQQPPQEIVEAADPAVEAEHQAGHGSRFSRSAGGPTTGGSSGSAAQ